MGPHPDRPISMSVCRSADWFHYLRYSLSTLDFMVGSRSFTYMMGFLYFPFHRFLIYQRSGNCLVYLLLSMPTSPRTLLSFFPS
ncbi:hypothetical protein P280DRAFT_115151 [Massarina eburnea CBS 473.64]|uniref:Uncharacterized protein n=1 Tax=Massarina eburnea CBS 473.64 TaxID=1395130 RepID=A0A6A6SBP4_9PLEO|nr:hypothetical protein P280DRAFT_115151 [Massarina eburnea CBS 473.64]